MERAAGREQTAEINNRLHVPCQTSWSTSPTLLQRPARSNNAPPTSSELTPPVHKAPELIPGNVLGGKHVLVSPVLKPPRLDPPVPFQRTPKTIPGFVRKAPGSAPPAPHQLGQRTGYRVTMQKQGRPKSLAASKDLSTPVHNKTSKSEPPEGQNQLPECGSSDSAHTPSSPRQPYNVLSVQNAGDRGLGNTTTDPIVQKLSKRGDASTNQISNNQSLLRTKADQFRPQTPSASRAGSSLLTLIARCPPTTSSIHLKNGTESSTDSFQSRATTKSSQTDAKQLRLFTRPTTNSNESSPAAQSTSIIDSSELRPTTRSPPRTDSSELRPTTRSPQRTHSSQLRPTTRSPLRTDSSELRPTTRSPQRTHSSQLRPTTRSPPRMDCSQLRPTTRSPPRTDCSQLRPTTRSPPRTDSSELRPTTRSPQRTHSSQLRPTTRSPPRMDCSQLRPTTRSPPRMDSSQLRPTTRSPPRTDTSKRRPTTRSPPRTDTSKRRPTTRSPPRTDSSQLRPTTRSPPRTDSSQLRPTTRSPPRTDSSQLRPTTRSPQKTAKFQKTERKPVKLQTEAYPKPHCRPGTSLDSRTDIPMTVCDQSNKGAHREDSQQPSVARYEKMQNRWDGDFHFPRSNAATKKVYEWEEEEDAEEDSGLFIPVDEHLDDERKRRKRLSAKRRRENKPEEDEAPVPCELDQALDRALEDGAKQHNLTAINVRNILHEVITNEHVVAMMKAAITETEGMPLFEPKMTRSKLKEVVEKGVVIPTWNLSPIKNASKVQAPQFVDIPLEEEDSSDEEYQPDEEEEDETAEESLLESDVESTASSPRGHRRLRVQHLSESQEEEAADGQNASLYTTRHIGFESAPMGPPPPPKVKHTQDVTFMEKLHAVDEELERHLFSMDSYQSLDESLIAFRTRSKRPLKNVPIGQLEAALQAPDFTPDMYDQSTADDEYWKLWLRSLMQDDVGNEDEGDDDEDDDPEYNFLEEWDEPDTEDLRNDRAVRITKKEVNGLMEELFETFQDEMGLSHFEDEGPDDEDSNSDPLPNFNTPQAIRFEEPLANLLTEQHRTVKAQLEYLRMRKSMMKADDDKSPARDPETQRPPAAPKVPPVLMLDTVQRKRLQQQMQQHVQLLTQLHLLTFRNPRLSVEAETAQMYLVELSSFAESSFLSRQQTPGFQSAFHPCNLGKAMQLIPLVHSQVPEDPEVPKPVRKKGNDVSDLSKHMAWVMATQPVFMYPELLPVCSMRAPGPRDKVFFTKAEDNLLALGLKHFEGTDISKPLIGKYLLTAKTAQQMTVRIKNLTMKKTPENVIKFYKKNKMLPPLSRCCEDVPPQDVRPPVEREKHRLPFWVKASLSSIEAYMERLEKDTKCSDSQYPLILPPAVALTLKPLPKSFYRRLWRQKRPSVLKPLLIRPSVSITCTPKLPSKPAAPQPVPIRIIGQVPPLVQPAVQGVVNIQPISVPLGRKVADVCRTAPVCANSSATTTVTHIPMSQNRMIMPATSNTRIRKSLLGGIPKIKTVPRTAGIKATPLVHSAPVLFTVPNGALKLVSLGAPCGVLQPVGTSTGVPVTTVLINPTHMSLSQTLLSTPLKQMQRTVCVAPDVGGGPSLRLETETSVKEDVCRDYRTVQVTSEGSPTCTGEGSPDRSHNEDGGMSDSAGEQSPSEDKPPKEMAHSTDGSNDVTTSDKQSEQNLQSNDGGASSTAPLCGSAAGGELSHTGASSTAPLCGSAAGGEQSHTGEVHGEEQIMEVLQKDERDPKQEDLEEPEGINDPQKQESEGGAAASPKNTSPSTDGDIDMSSPSGAPRDSSSPSGGQDLTNDKEGAEEEEEEDFDDLTQDEDEMSSASEESVLSVPELQETMEKLTWLASERRLSQEGDSEENSQEENTEEEEEEDAVETKPEGMTDETGEECEKLDSSHLRVPSPAPVEASAAPAGERRRTGTKGPNSHRVRNRKGRARASKDASKLLLLCDEKILLKDPLREQKDMAYARSYLNRVREALQSAPGTYEHFLNIIYEFETSSDKKTAVDLYESLQHLLQDWPQLLKDFAAFLLPEQALECGLFEEQQAFEKSRRFLRQLEICFKENPAHHQKIIKLLQSCAECPLQKIGKLKTQMWQLLKGHHHLQEEFSLFFDQLRPPASRMEDFEVMHWTEEKEYKFDGFEEVSLPEVDEEEETSKVHPAQRNKRRKESSQSQDKDVDWLDGGKDCPCSCHDGGTEQRLKRSKRRLCNHCSNKACENRSQRSADAAYRQHSAGEGRSLVKSSAEERTHRSRSSLHTRGMAEGTSKSRTPSNGRSAIRAARRPHTSKNLASTLTEKESEFSPQSDPCTPNSVDNPGTPAEGATRCPTPTESLSTSLCETNLTAVEKSALQGADREEQTLPMCAKNIRLSSSGEKVIVWTREADRVILTMCQERGAHDQTFGAISAQLGNKSPSEVAQRFRELMSLFQTSCVTSSDEEEEEEDVTLMEGNMSDPENAHSEDD